MTRKFLYAQIRNQKCKNAEPILKNAKPMLKKMWNKHSVNILKEIKPSVFKI